MAIIRIKATAQVGCKRRRTPSTRLITGPVLFITATAEARYRRRRAPRLAAVFTVSRQESVTNGVHLTRSYWHFGRKACFCQAAACLKASEEECNMVLSAAGINMPL
jgi:hypothetical protein